MTQDQPGTATYALVSLAYQNDSTIVDKGGLFAPEISLVNLEELWPVTAAAKVSELTSTISLRARAQRLVETGAAVSIRGAEAVLNTTIDLLTSHRRQSQPKDSCQEKKLADDDF